MSHGCKNLLLATKNLRLDTNQSPKSRNFAPKIASNMNINILAATAAPSFADTLAWCFPLVVVVASAIGFGFAAYYWGRNARIENYLRRRKEEANRASRQNQPN